MLNKKESKSRKSIGTEPPLQIYPILFIIKFNTKNCFNHLSANPKNGQAHSNNLSAAADKFFECVWPFWRLTPGEKGPIVPAGTTKHRWLPFQDCKSGHKWQSWTMSKIETTRTVSLKLTSRINLGRWGAHAHRALNFGHSPQALLQSGKG